MTSDDGQSDLQDETQSTPDFELPEQYTLRISRLALAAIALFVLIAVVAFSQYVVIFLPLVVIAGAVLWWTMRNQTTVDAEGLTLRRTFTSRQLAWSQIKGLVIPKRGWLRVALIEGGEVRLPGVGYDRLGELILTSHGHIPDPFPS